MGAKFCWFAALTLIAASPLQGGPLRDPKRVVSDHTVDLNPLFHYWTNHVGPRPLTAWAHVTGSVVGTNGLTWVVEAHVAGGASNEGGGQHRVLLRHPPLQDRAEFEQLAARLKALNDQRSAITGQQSKVKQQAKALNSQPNRVAHREARVLNAAAKSAQPDVTAIDKQIQDVKHKLAAYPSPDHYAVDCFALQTGEQSAHLPIYDYGVAVK